MDRLTGRRPAAVVAWAVAMVLTASGCATFAAADSGRSGGGATGALVTPTTVPSGLSSTDSPLSGLPGGAGKPVLVVKIDNTHQAQPQAGLRDADVVYIEEVEWGLTRIAAVFSSKQPKSVGPVRSARITDLELLRQYGKVAFAYSGAQTRMLPLLANADLYDVSGDRDPTGYRRASDRRAPYNFMGTPAKLLARAPKAAAAHDMGFTFAAKPPAGGVSGRTLKARWPDSSAEFRYDSAGHRYDVRLNDRPARAAEGGQQHARTVVVQYVEERDSGFGDKYGGKTPLSITVGTGAGWVLRDGKAYKVTWSRPTPESGTVFAGKDGSPVAFRPGQVWVLLVNKVAPVTLR